MKHSQEEIKGKKEIKGKDNQACHTYLNLIRCYLKLEVKRRRTLSQWKRRSLRRSRLPLHLTHLMRSGGPQEKGDHGRCSPTRRLVNRHCNHIPMSTQFMPYSPCHTFPHTHLTIFHLLSCFRLTCLTLLTPMHLTPTLHQHFIEIFLFLYRDFEVLYLYF